MEWGRVKTIFIIIFSAVNVFLLSIYLKAEYTNNMLEDNIVKDTVQILSANNIEIDKDTVPKSLENVKICNIENTYADTETMLKVIYKNAEKNGMEWFNQSNVDVDGANFTCNIPGTDKNNYDNPEKYAEKVFSKIGLISAGQYKIIKKDDKIFFYLTFDGKIIFDSYIYIKVKDNKITEIFGSNCLGDKVTEGSMAKVVSPAEILINFASEYGEPGKMRITNIESGYFAGKRTKAVKITAAPVWKAKTSDGKVFYFDMRNGDLLE